MAGVVARLMSTAKDAHTFPSDASSGAPWAHSQDELLTYLPSQRERATHRRLARALKISKAVVESFKSSQPTSYRQTHEKG